MRLLKAWLAQPPIGWPPSMNSIEPLGSVGPALLPGTPSVAMYVARYLFTLIRAELR